MERTFFFQIEPTLGGNIFVSDFFSTSAASRPTFFPITGIRLLISGKALDRSDRLSRLLRAFLYDRFKIYLIVPIVRIELNSILAIEVVSDVWVVWDRPGSVPHMVVPLVWTLFETTGTIGTIICMETRLYQVRCSKLVPFPLVKIARSFQKRIGFDLLYFYKGLGRKIFAKSYLKRLFVMFCEGKTTKEKCQFFFILSKASHL